jgi:hypothetical protein
MGGYFGYNEGSNEPPLGPPDPVRPETPVPPFKYRLLLAVLFLLLVIGAVVVSNLL